MEKEFREREVQVWNEAEKRVKEEVTQVQEQWRSRE